jgi:hypothetical protein
MSKTELSIEHTLATVFNGKHVHIRHQVAKKIVLPRRPGESSLQPQQYWYAASESGVVPSSVIADRQPRGLKPPQNNGH